MYVCVYVCIYIYICCGDYNTSFERLNAQTECLNNFISHCNIVALWEYQRKNLRMQICHLIIFLALIT